MNKFIFTSESVSEGHPDKICDQISDSVVDYYLENSKTIFKGDQKIKCISSASIVAKVYRDLYMIKLGNKFPKYKWHKNFGYGTSQHMNALKKFGVTNYHRRSYKPVHNILSK